MADPFILKEKYLPSQSSPRLIGGSMSGAAMPLTNLPGAGLEQVGKESQKAINRLWKLERGRVEAKNTLDAQTNATKFGLEATKKLQSLLTQEKFTVDGKETTFEEQANTELEKLRNGYLTGTNEVDTPFLEKSNYTNQRLQGLILEQSSIRLQKATGKAYAENQTLKLNQISEHQDIKLHGVNDTLFSSDINMEGYFRDFEADAVLAIDDIDELTSWEVADRDELKLTTLQQYTTEYIDVLLRKGLWKSAEHFIENRLATKDSNFFMAPEKLSSVREKIEREKLKIPKGLVSQINSEEQNAFKLYESGNIGAATRAAANVRSLYEAAKVTDYQRQKFEIGIDVATEYWESTNEMMVTPHGSDDLGERLVEKYKDTPAAALAINYKVQLDALRTKKRKEFGKSPADYAMRYDEGVLNLFKEAAKHQSEGNLDKHAESMGRAIKASLKFQKFIDPTSAGTILTLEELESTVERFNQESFQAKTLGATEIHQELRLFFKRFGPEYGGRVLGELQNPEHTRDNYNGEKLKSAIGIAALYPNSRVSNLIMTSSNEYDQLTNYENMPWARTDVSDLREELISGSEELYKSLGYATFREFSNSSMLKVMTGYALSLARQRGLDMNSTTSSWSDVIEETLFDLVESKWSMYENPVTGSFSDGSTVRYLSIPKVDNEGLPFDHEALAITLDYIRDNPDSFDIDGKSISDFIDVETGSEFGEMFAKDALVFINSGDGNGINIALYDKSNRGHLIILGDSIPWSELNHIKHPDLFKEADENHRSLFESGWGLIKQELTKVGSMVGIKDLGDKASPFGGYFTDKEKALTLYRKNVGDLRLRSDVAIQKIKSYNYPDKEKERLIKIIEDKFDRKTDKMMKKIEKKFKEEYNYQNDRINSKAYNVDNDIKKSFSNFWKQLKADFTSKNSEIKKMRRSTRKSSKSAFGGQNVSDPLGFN